MASAVHRRRVNAREPGPPSQPLVRAGEQTQPPNWGICRCLSLCMEGLILKLQNPLLDDGVRGEQLRRLPKADLMLRCQSL
jgi:hypothetical protein